MKKLLLSEFQIRQGKWVLSIIILWHFYWMMLDLEYEFLYYRLIHVKYQFKSLWLILESKMNLQLEVNVFWTLENQLVDVISLIFFQYCRVATSTWWIIALLQQGLY